MANVMAAFASRAPRARRFRASLAASETTKSFALAQSQLMQHKAARIPSDTNYLARTIRRQQSEAGAMLAPATRVVSPTLPLMEPASRSELQPVAGNFWR